MVLLFSSERIVRIGSDYYARVINFTDFLIQLSRGSGDTHLAMSCDVRTDESSDRSRLTPVDIDAGRLLELPNLESRYQSFFYAIGIALRIRRYLRSRRLAPPRRMEFDGSESVIAMVQEGLGWALTTPLCLLQARADLSRLTLRALPAGAPRRGLFLVSRAGRAEPSFEAVTPVVQRLLRRLTRTRLRARVPGAGQIEVG